MSVGLAWATTGRLHSRRQSHSMYLKRNLNLPISEKLSNSWQAGILVAAGQTGLKAIVTSGSTTLGTQTLSSGFNGFSFLGMTTGTVSVTVVNSAGTTVISGTGPIAVSRFIPSGTNRMLIYSRL